MNPPPTSDQRRASGSLRPATLWVALVALGIETVALLGAGVWALLLAFAATQGGSALVALGAMLAVLGFLLGAVTSGVARGLRWARPASVAWQLLQLVSGVAIVGQTGALGIGVIAVAAVTLVGLFAPPTLTWYEQQIAAVSPH